MNRGGERVEVDREEAILTLRKNKLEMEHEALLQDRNVILITEVGLPITILNIIITARLYAQDLITAIVLASVLLIAIVERIRRQKETEIRNKRNEIDDFLQQYETED